MSDSIQDLETAVRELGALPMPAGPEPEMPCEQRAAIAKLIGDAKPATAHLVEQLAKSVRDIREHEHPTWEDLHCQNLQMWLGERVGPVVRRLLDAEDRIERRRSRLVALQNDALNVRGSLSPNGGDRKVPFPLGETLAPAVDWLIARIAELEADQAANDREYEAAVTRIAELEAKLTEAERASETNFWWYVGQKDRADAAREDAVAALTEAAELSPEHAETLHERARSIAKAPTWPDHDQLGKSSRTPADATPDAAREGRLAQLLDTIRTYRGEWRAGDVVVVRRLSGGPVQRSVARRDLTELCRRGHLNQHGPKDGRFYTLKRKRTRGGDER